MNSHGKIKVSDLPEFDPSEHLKDEADIAAYLDAVLEENDAALLAAALGDIARAHGMAEVAQKAGIGREALYKALRPAAHPRFETISRVCRALGVRLTAVPAERAAKPEKHVPPGNFKTAST
ncbi:MAG: putative addiction module antidote protein [Candidatus Accumulibacter sp.]|jgi:probable addiction module antidote protein|nr:putative addiction module antidote protein [Accumulibacter sp.]